MEVDKGAAGCFVGLMVIGVVVLGAVLIATNVGGFMDNANRSEAARLQAQADLTRAQRDMDREHNEHTETMFMLWTASLAAFTGGQGLLDLLGLVLIGVLALAGGYALGVRRT